MKTNDTWSKERWSHRFILATTRTFCMLRSMGYIMRFMYGSFFRIYMVHVTIMIYMIVFINDISITTPKLYHLTLLVSPDTWHRIFILCLTSTSYIDITLSSIISLSIFCSLFIRFNLLNSYILGTEFEECVILPVDDILFGVSRTMQ